MTENAPLTDEDRAAWLGTLRSLLIQNVHSNRSVVLACSALKETYRQILRVNALVYVVYLKGSKAEIQARLDKSEAPSTRPDFLASELEILEEPRDALVVEINKTPGEIIREIRNGLKI